MADEATLAALLREQETPQRRVPYFNDRGERVAGPEMSGVNQGQAQWPLFDPRKAVGSAVDGALSGIGGNAPGAISAAAKHIGDLATSSPKLVAAVMAALGLTAAPSEASNETTPKDYQAPSLAQELWRSLPFTSNAEDQRPQTRDEYIAKRGRPVTKSKDEFISSEVDKMRKTERYEEAGPNLRKKLEDEGRRSAEQLYKGYQESQGAAASSLDADYGAYVDGWKKQRGEHLNKQFAERHPTANMALTVGGPAVGAVFTRGIFGKYNKMGDEIAAAGKTARTADDSRALADSIVRADKFGPRAAIAKGLTVTEAALLPAELRMTSDIIDKKALPPDSGARQAAEQRMGDIPTYAKGMGYDLVSGGIGAAGGALWAKARTPSPGVDLAALRNHAAGVDRGGFPEFAFGERMPQDTLSKILADRAVTAIRAQDRVNAARQGVPNAPPGSGGGPSAGLAPDTQGLSGSAVGGALVPRPSSNDGLSGLLREPQGQLPAPGVPSNPEFLKTLGTPANRNISKQAEPNRIIDKNGIKKVKDPDNGQFMSDPDK